jgi:tRNA nucleotidyltransferase (CCA-adding enzyme)
MVDDPMMKLFLVGGAVRDRLLGREPKDMDFVVVGSTEAELLTAFPTAVKQGAAFPVYRVDGLGEVALARRERKTGTGHTAFAVEFGPEVTLEEDLSRRDLTVNAMAMDMETGQVVDPFGGQKDLQDRVLRHVSDAFADDALRVYRVARFAAQLGFQVALDTHGSWAPSGPAGRRICTR